VAFGRLLLVKTYDTSADAHYVQIDDKVLIMNGTDVLSYFDITTAGAANTITAFTSIGTPTSPTATKTGLAGVTLTYYYKITANSATGQSAATADATVTVDRQRASWDSTTNYVTVGWTAPAGATSSTTYNVYVGVAPGQEFLVATVNGTTYKDTGADPQDVTQVAPTFDSSGGPRVTRGRVINGQVWLWGDADHKRYVWFGGTGQSVLDFSPLNGGGNVEIGRGTKEFPASVAPFRDHAGNPAVTILTQGTNGTGTRYNLKPNSITYGSVVISFFDVEEDNGQAGTDSPDGVIIYNDSLWYPSKGGFKTTGTKPQLQNLLSTDTITETIYQDVQNLNQSYMNTCVGLGYQNRLYWLVPNGLTTPTELWILDLQRGGAWMKPLTIPSGATWMTLYNSNTVATGGDGQTHILIVDKTLGEIKELTYASMTQDITTSNSANNLTVATSVASGVIKFSEDGMEWAKLIRVVFFVLRPVGTINFAISARTEDSQVANVGSSSITPVTTVAGWGEAGWGGGPDLSSPKKPSRFAWSSFYTVPVTVGTVLYPVQIDIDEDVNYFNWQIYSNTSGVDYNLSDVVAEYVVTGSKDLN
jgi:hypothetical protein